MTEKAEVVGTSFHKTVICSKAALSYDQAQLKVDDKNQQDPLAKNLRILNNLAKHLKAGRNAAGALTLASPEVRFKLDSETQDPTDVAIYQHKEVNSMVEEFMLLANVSVATKIYEHYPLCSLLRCHPTPAPGSFDILNKALALEGLSLDVSSSKMLAESLDKAVKPDDPYFNQLVRILATRCMKQAEYFCSADKTEEEFRHYGLASAIYTHFTSPIRRYADQVAHRLLAGLLRIEPLDVSMTDPEGMAGISSNINSRHVMAQFAGRASVGLHTLFYFREREVEEDALVIKVKERAVVVLVPRYGIEGIVRTCKRDDRNPFEFDEELMQLTSPSCRLSMFQRVRVRVWVDKAKPHRPQVVLTLTDPKLPSV